MVSRLYILTQLINDVSLCLSEENNFQVLQINPWDRIRLFSSLFLSLSWPSSHPPPVPVLVSLVPDIFGLQTQGFLLLSPVWPAFCTQLCSLTSSRFEILDSGIRDAHFGILTLSLTNQVTVNLSWFLHLSGGSHLTTFQDCCRFRGDQRISEI